MTLSGSVPAESNVSERSEFLANRSAMATARTDFAAPCGQTNKTWPTLFLFVEFSQVRLAQIRIL